MSTTVEELSAKDFAQNCINSLADVKRSMPGTYKNALAPYKLEITAEAVSAKVANTEAVINILTRINRDTEDMAIIKMKHLFFLAAYCDML